MATGDIYVNCTTRALSADALFKSIVVEDSNGKPALKVLATVSATIDTPIESVTTTDLIQSLEPAGSQTLAGLNTAYQLWKSNNATKKVLRESSIVGGDGIPGIFITYLT